MQTICGPIHGANRAARGALVSLRLAAGNGATTKLIMQHVRPAQLVGIDPSRVFIDMAPRDLRRCNRGVSFAVGDACVATGRGGRLFLILLSRTRSTRILVDPEGALAEAHRVSQAGRGRLVIFDRRLRDHHRRPCSMAIRCSPP